MIMSTFTFASASAVSTRPAMPGLSGQARERDARLRGRVRHGCDEWSFHRLLLVLDDGTGSVLEARSAVDRDAVVARVLHGAQLQHAGARGRHLEHLLEREHAAACAPRHDARVGAEHARHVGEDLADLGAEGRGQGDRGGVGAAAAERGHVERVLDTPWKPATSTILPVVERRAGCGRPSPR